MISLKSAYCLILNEVHVAMETKCACPVMPISGLKVSYFFLLFGVSPTFSYFRVKFLLFPTFLGFYLN